MQQNLSMPDEMIESISEFLDPFTVISNSIRISRQFHRISQEHFNHLQLFSHQEIQYHLMHQCTYFKSLTSLDLTKCPIGEEDFRNLLTSGNLTNLKTLSISDHNLAMVVGNVLNECMVNLLKNVDVEYCLPNLEIVQVENICQLNLINPVEYLKQINLLAGNLGIIALKPELFGKSQALSSLQEYIMIPVLNNISNSKNILLYGPKKSGKKLVLNEFRESFPCNTIVPFYQTFNDLNGGSAINWLFKLSRSFGEHALSLLTFDFDLIDMQTNRLNATQLVLELTLGRNFGGSLITILRSNNPCKINSALRRRFDFRVLVNILTGDDLRMFVKFQLDKRFSFLNFTTIQIEQITTLCEGYSPCEIELMINAVENGSKIIECMQFIIENSVPVNTKEDVLEIERFESDYNMLDL